MSFFSKFQKKDPDTLTTDVTRATATVELEPPRPVARPVEVPLGPPPKREILHLPVPPAYALLDLLTGMVAAGASDLHLAVGQPPMVRINGKLTYSDAKPLVQAHAESILLKALSAEQRARFGTAGNVDFSYEVKGLARFRGNYFYQYRGIAAVFRIIPEKIPTFEELNMPEALKKVAMYRTGLVVVTGPTGSGKSTTLAAIINYINQKRNAHLITIEDPVEFCHPNKSCLVDHREVGEHAVSFSDALRAALREDPDILLVGEMRDLETIYQAIKAAETGVLVFGTLHTNSASKTIDRIIGVFPSKQQEQIRAMLAESLKAVIAQQLLRKTGGGRVAAHEILTWSPGLSNLIRKGDTSQIPNLIVQGRTDGMQTMDGSLRKLVEQGVITKEVAMEKAQEPTKLDSAI